ncbi:MAG: right-handed parallel beta-helix repeat-containing protein [Planctomycetes bacterium]|nr:right-handed parallel beta-helix repeat-containing protein [Planctomycetota bacterium]
MIFSTLILAPLLVASTWTVDGGGGGDFLTIQAAIDASAPGDLIQVTPGTYEEDLIIHVSVTIEGLAGGAVTIYPATSNPGTGTGAQIDTTTQACIVEAHDVTLRGLTMNGNNPALSAFPDARNGIITNYLTGPWDRLTVEDCKVRNVELRAIFGSTGDDHLFRGNTVRNAKGMALESSGLMLWAATGVIENNIVKECSLGITSHNRSAGDIFNNQISGCDVGVLTNGTDSPSAVYSNTFTDCLQGHQLIGLHADVTCRNNTFIDCKWGVNFFGSTANGFIEDNVFDAPGLTLATGVRTNTDLSPWGTNQIVGHVRRNQFLNLSTGIIFQETGNSRHELVALQIGGSELDANSFRSIANLNVELIGCNDDIDASYNSWGIATAAALEASIHHQVDDPALGLVDFSNAVIDVVLVDSSGGGDYLTIQEGVDAVTPGGLVSVALGDYIGSVVVNKSLTLQGSGMGEEIHTGTRVFGDDFGPGVGNDVITVLADGVELSNMWIDGWSNAIGDRLGACIMFDSTRHGFVHEVFVHQAVRGIYSYFSDLQVQNSIAEDCGTDLDNGGGMVFSNSTGSVGGVGLGNTAQDCLGRGFLALQCSSITLRDNFAINCEVGFTASNATGPNLLRGNGASACNVGFLGESNNADVDLIDNTVINRPWHTSGISLYGNGSGTYNLTGNTTDGSGAAAYSLYVSPHTLAGSSDVHAVLRDNCFLNSNNGIFLDERGGAANVLDLDMNGALGGHNIIAGQAQYSVYLKRCNDPLDMTSTYWGTTDPLAIADRIFDSADDPSLGTVDAATPLLPAPDLRVDAVHRSVDYQVQIIVTGNPGDAFTIGGSRSLGNWNTRYGTLSISKHNTFEVVDHRVPASGVYIGRAPSIPGLTGPVYLQGVVFGGVKSITNLEEILLREAP